MKTLTFQQCVSNLAWMLLLVSSAGHTQVYKWVDAEGKTHYSEKKEDAGKFKTEELKVPAQPPSPRAKPPSAQYWQEQDAKFRQRQIERSYAENHARPRPTVPESLSGGRSDDTAASKCNLARDILGGAVRHGNGARTDKYDIDLAKEDVRTYCR